MFHQGSSTLAGVPREILQAWRSTALEVLAELQTGAKVVSATYAQADGSKSVTYSQANLGDLNNWIMLLNEALGVTRGVRRPMRPFFPRR